MIPFLSAFQYLLDLLPSVLDDDRFEIGYIERIGYDSNLVNMWIAFESIDGMLYDHFSRYLEELLGSGQSQAATDSSCQYDCYILFHCINRNVMLQKYELIASLQHSGWEKVAYLLG